MGPTIDDWNALRAMVRQSIRDNLVDGRTVDDAAEDLQHVFNKWATDRELSWIPTMPGAQHYQPPGVEP